MVASTVVPLTPKSQEIFIEYYRSLQSLQNISRHDSRSRYEYIDRAYQRELDLTDEQLRAKQANRLGDPTRYQDMTIPVVKPHVETATSYQTAVFLTGEPIFGVVASPSFVDQALQMQTVLEEQAIRGGWTHELMKFFRNGAKYNFAPVEVSWDSEVTASIETDIAKDPKHGIPKEVIWTGNKLRSLDPYNTFVDTRVAPSELYKKGEFGGFTEFMSRIELKAFISRLPETLISNIKPAFESGIGAPSNISTQSMSYYIPQINLALNPTNYTTAGMDWMAWAGLSSIRKNIDYKDAYEVTTVYCKVIPSDFELRIPKRETPQIYKLVIVNHQHIIYAERQTNAHGYLPIFIGQPLDDGLGYQTKSLAQDSLGFQELATAYMSSIIASRRRSVSDRVLYDPSRITSAAINAENPSAKIPVRPAAYGKNIADSVYQFPYREDQSQQAMVQIQQLLALSNSLAGQNQASQGQFVKGNKTLQEFDTVMANANGRDQMASILLEAQVFMPIKQVLKLNILQYQGGTTLFNRDKNVDVEIDPIALRKAVLEFRISDGLIPASKLINGDSLAVALQVLGSSPELAAGYNVASLFSYLMKTQGAQISEFEKSSEQIAFESALAQWQSIATLAIEKGVDLKSGVVPPPPLPEQYGYDPTANTPSPSSTGAQSPEMQKVANTPATPGVQA